MYTLHILLLTIHWGFEFAIANEPEVCIDALGCVEGTLRPGNEVGRYDAFMGIPFAKPPIGDLRFKNPVPADAWVHKLIAKEPRSDCLQKHYIAPTQFVTGEEDCLYLNIYRPIDRSSEKLPVLFYIHGGGFFCGSANPKFSGPEYFMDTSEIILVVAAYRLGPFGFLSTGDEHMTGNFGLKDQRMALKWVHKYISAFGGDPTRVTIFGHSAGGVAVHLHLLNPASRGLFRNGILMSGVAIAPFVRYMDENAIAVQVAIAAGITNASEISSSELVDSLRKVNASDLLQASDVLKKWYVYPFINYRPNVEQESWPDAFITRDVFESFNNKPPLTMPWIAGSASTKGEGIVMALKLASNPNLQAEFNSNFDEMLCLVCDIPVAGKMEKAKEIIDLLVAKYMGGVRELNKDTMDGFLELLGDANFIYPLYKTIEANVNTGNEAQIPTGIIKFNYRGPYSFAEFFSGATKDYGTAHTDDILYLFGMPFSVPQGYAKSSPEAQFVKRYVGLHVEFAKTGNVEAFMKTGRCTKETFAARQKDSRMCDYLSIVNDTEPFQIDTIWDIERMKLWDNAYKTFL
ncbi:juvenile hormone esterase-like isoform X2 [Eurosta solidaginis]